MIEQINQDIETHLNNPNLSVSFLAEKAGYTPAYLGQLYKRFGSRSLTDKINEERINRAAQILRSTTKTLSEVAAEVGIVNESYFSTLFKKYKGISPGRFGK